MLGGPRIREPRILQQIIVRQQVEKGGEVDLDAGPDALREATLWLMQTFVVSFDVSVLAMWLPCAFLLSRLKNR
jgi:hypothetical protein